MCHPCPSLTNVLYLPRLPISLPRRTQHQQPYQWMCLQDLPTPHYPTLPHLSTSAHTYITRCGIPTYPHFPTILDLPPLSGCAPLAYPRLTYPTLPGTNSSNPPVDALSNLPLAYPTLPHLLPITLNHRRVSLPLCLPLTYLTPPIADHPYAPVGIPLLPAPSSPYLTHPITDHPHPPVGVPSGPTPHFGRVFPSYLSYPT